MSMPKNNIRYLNVNRSQLKKNSLSNLNTDQLETIMFEILSNTIHGISFSPYLEGQTPSLQSKITPEQIAERLEIIRPYTQWIRTFSCTNGNEHVPKIAKEKKLKTMVGVWLGEDKQENQKEIANAIRLAKEGHVDMLAVGNEVLLREDLSIGELLEYIDEVKQAVPNIPVGYVDAYYMFVNYPEIINHTDIIFANCYPFWEHCNLEISVDYMKHMYEMVQDVANGKPIIISETGWPSKGMPYGEAIPSYENAMNYFIQSQIWANANRIDVFYFSSFDEVWKMDHEGEYGAYWGLWDKNGTYKFKK